jgi:acetolactate synthase-1/2/3 large subunit
MTDELDTIPTSALSEPEATTEPLATAEPEATAEPVAIMASRTGPGPEAEPGVERGPEVEPLPELAAPGERQIAAPPRTVGRYVAESLRSAGVRMAFTVPGESFLGLLEALPAAGIRVIATRHEGGAAFMAEAHGQLTGRPAACLATRAVGAANLAIGIQTAREDSTPMFAIVGGVERRFRGRDAFQEADIAGSIGRLAKWSAEVTTGDAIPAMLDEAIRQASLGRPGPVVLVLPEDLLDEPMQAEAPTTTPARGPGERIDPSTVGAILHLLTDARHPLILAGAGVLRARCTNDLVRLAEMVRVPVMTSWRRGDAFPNDHPLYLGMTGYASPSVVRERLLAADAVLVLGSRLNEVTTFGYAWPGPTSRWAHVDLAPIGNRDGMSHPTIAVNADARSFVRASIARLAGAVLDKETADARANETAAAHEAWEAATTVDPTPWPGAGVHPGHVIASLREVLPAEAIVTTDAGNFGGWAARYFRFRRPGTFIGPTSGAMGYALPAAIAASLIHRDRAVVALAGDGGFAMTMAELETAVRTRARVVCLVFDNERYGTIRMHQDRRRDAQPVATDLGPIDFAGAARAIGAIGVRVSSDAEVEPALREALAADGPVVLHLQLDRLWVGVDADAPLSD